MLFKYKKIASLDTVNELGIRAVPPVRDTKKLTRLLIEAGEDLIRADGLDNLTARKLASRAGVALGTTYNVFENLDALVAEVNARTLDRLFDWMAQLPTESDDIEELLMQFADHYQTFIDENAHVWEALFAETRSARGDATFPNRSKVARLFMLLETAIAPLFGGEVTTDCATSARVLWASLHGIILLNRGGRIPPLQVDDARVLVESLIRNHVAGLRSRTG